MKVCDICGGPIFARTYCNAHYKRWHRYGDPTAGYVRGSTINLEDVEWMAETGESLTGAAVRLGIKPGSLEKNLTDRGQRELLFRLRRREPTAVAS